MCGTGFKVEWERDLRTELLALVSGIGSEAKEKYVNSRSIFLENGKTR